jgi:endonuclease YncB( thermonuclease family)
MEQGLRMNAGSRARGAAYARRCAQAAMPVVMLCSLLCCATTVQAKPRSGELNGELSGELKGVVTHVSDGDTLWVRLAAGERRDAPEICQAGGPQSLAALKAKVQGQTVTLQTNRYDDYGRMLARVSLTTGAGTSAARQDIGAWMVERGQA